MPTPDDFTGERFLPECTGEIWVEHWHRYLFAARYVAGKDVLDAACGEGYGAALLSRHARNVTGLDLDKPTIAAARAKYQAPGLRFETGSVADMPFADASFDCAVSFETLEHLAEQQATLSELRRVLRPDGILIISTPNRVEYSDNRAFHNEFHVRELYEDEFRTLLGQNFGAQQWYGQRLVFNSALWSLADAAGAARNAEWIALDSSARMMPPPMYFVALAAASAPMLPSLANGTLLADPEDAIYQGYEQTIARTRMLESLVTDRERHVVERDRQLLLSDGRMQQLEGLIAKRDAIVVERDRQLSALADRADAMERLIAERERLIVERDGQIEAANALLAKRERMIAERELLIAERERLIEERDVHLSALNTRAETAEERVLARERLILERDRQLAAASDWLGKLERLLVEREAIIVERDAQLVAVNARMAAAEQLIAERERVIVERDAQIGELNARIEVLDRDAAQLNERLSDLHRQLVQRDELVSALTLASDDLRREVNRRAGWRWWLVIPYLKLRRMLAPTRDVPRQNGP